MNALIKQGAVKHFLVIFAVLPFAGNLFAAVNVAPKRNEGEGPFDRLIIRGAIVIDGTGAPPKGPIDIVIEGNKIKSLNTVGIPHVPIKDEDRPEEASKEIDAHGSYVMPGFINLHGHVGDDEKTPDAEYVYKLWMAHGITTIRGVPAGDVNWTAGERRRSAANLITAPRIVAYQVPGKGEDWARGKIDTPAQARAWVRWAKDKGIEGIKTYEHPPEIMRALLGEAAKLKMGSVAHINQMMVAGVNAVDAARMGLTGMTHFYGLFEAMYEAEDIQHWPVDMNYSNEQARFAQVARQWRKVIPGGEKWNAVKRVFLEHDFFIDPTMTAYVASRDVMRARNADWHDKYTLPSLWDFYMPSRTNHGSYFYSWTRQDEVEWKNFFRVWMRFLNEYKNAGGRVTVSDDAGFIYNLFGFGYIEEMELLQEAGFHPLEVIRGATMHAAQNIFEPKGQAIKYGVIRPGLLADLVIVDENPIHDLKVLYGTGTVRLNDKTGKPERVGGVKYTIKDGIIYDAKALLNDVEEMVNKQKRERGIKRLPEY